MGFIAKAKANPNTTTTTTNSEKRGMGFLLVFFPEEHNNNNNNNNNNNLTSLSPNTTTRLIRRTNSSLILTKAQSTISICALLVFLTLLLFTLSTFEPTIPTPTPTTTTSRRFLSQKNPTLYPNKLKTNSNSNTSHNSWFLKMWSENPNPKPKPNTQTTEHSSIALQRLGTLYRRGTRAMSDLVVGHVAEDVIEDDLRLFLRVLHRSGLTARADIVFIFGSSLLLSRFSPVIQEENESFLKLVHNYKETKNITQDSLLGFDLTQFVKLSKKEMGEPLWGKKIRVNNNNNNNSGEAKSEGELTRLSYGSVVSFEVNELDPEDSLAGFLDHVPMSLKRWACYPMLLGRVRRNFKHVMLVDVKNLVVLGDPLGRVRNRSPESVYVSMKQEIMFSKHHKKNSEKTQSHCLVNSVILMGGARGIRRLSNSMLNEIVRAAMQHKKKSSVTESGILSQLVCNEYLLKNINLIKSTESIPDTSSLIGLSSSFATRVDYSVIQRGNSNYDLNSIIMRQICSCKVDSSVYKNC